ncbi:hypothetical protein [Streptomyces halobius]|uniref:Lipoprotein n=1 Tax=Streptomyces halobius TaxID=2879846 RepID=A0ABY4MHR1_9ACTN|nr:hypothetical protein [Streptomyces halobius]UQA95950.1 hypothetical protein K9S39_32395 [Streptomyces halobius]
MSDQRAGRRSPSRTGAAVAVPLFALLAPLAACAPEPSASRYPDVQRMLDARARAVQERDAAGFLDSVDPRAAGYRDRQRQVFGRLAALPLTDWHYDLVSAGAFPLPDGGRGGRRLAAEVRLSYRLKGYDTAPVTAVQYLTLTERDGRWRISSDTDGAAAGKAGTRQLWDQGPVRLVRGRYSLVLGGTADPARLRELARRVDAAVPAVSAAWKGKWSRKVVVEVPDSVARMAQLLGGDDPSGYAGIAAVTAGEAGGSPGGPAAAPADRVIINPDAYEELNELGRTVVLTHETTHVATRTVTTPATPLWLSEGFADWAAYRGTHHEPATAAPELTRAVATGRSPARLPSDADFGFTTGADRLARAYEGGWLACRMIADKWGEARLRAFYRAAGKGGGGTSAGMVVAPMEAVRPTATGLPKAAATTGSGAGDDHGRPVRANPVDRAMRTQLGVGLAEFTRQWRVYVQEQLKGGREALK